VMQPQQHPPLNLALMTTGNFDWKHAKKTTIPRRFTFGDVWDRVFMTVKAAK